MSKLKHSVSKFSLIGQLLEFVRDGNQIKYLRIANPSGEYRIKLAKKLQGHLDPAISLGCWLHVMGKRKVSAKNGSVKLKAELAELARTVESDSQTITEVEPPQTVEFKQSIPNKFVAPQSRYSQLDNQSISQKLEKGLLDHWRLRSHFKSPFTEHNKVR